MKDFPPLDIALTSVLVASKAEETYKKIRQILAAAFLILNPEFKGSEVDIKVRNKTFSLLNVYLKIVEEHRRKVIQYEDRLLEAINFNFSITHPFQALLSLAQVLRESDTTVSSAFAWMQRLYMTSIVLHYPPHYLALAALVEARMGKSVTAELKMAEQLGINKIDLADITERYRAYWACIKE